MSRRKKRGRKRSTAVRSPESAALVPQEAGVSAEGVGPVSRPAWAPGDVDLFKVPEPVRRAVAEIVEPAYRKLVAKGVSNRLRGTGQRLGGETEGECGKLESCHPKPY